jgi:hypothetical protein
MKKTLKTLLVAAMVFCTIQAQSQIKVGIHAGLNLANVKLKGAELPSGADVKIIPSFVAGAAAEYSLAESFAVEAGLYLSGKGTRIEYSESESGATVTAKSILAPLYLEIPLNAIYKLKVGKSSILLFAGPYVGMGIAGKAKQKYSATGLPAGVTLSSLGLEDTSEKIKYGSSDKDDLKNPDFGFNFGVGIEIDNFQLRAQYGLGLVNLIPSGNADVDAKNKVIGITLGYMFGK